MSIAFCLLSCHFLWEVCLSTLAWPLCHQLPILLIWELIFYELIHKLFSSPMLSIHSKKKENNWANGHYFHFIVLSVPWIFNTAQFCLCSAVFDIPFSGCCKLSSFMFLQIFLPSNVWTSRRQDPCIFIFETQDFDSIGALKNVFKWYIRPFAICWVWGETKMWKQNHIDVSELRLRGTPNHEGEESRPLRHVAQDKAFGNLLMSKMFTLRSSQFPFPWVKSRWVRYDPGASAVKVQAAHKAASLSSLSIYIKTRWLVLKFPHLRTPWDEDQVLSSEIILTMEVLCSGSHGSSERENVVIHDEIHLTGFPISSSP